MSSVKRILSILFVITASTSLTGCGVMLAILLTETTQTITIEAEDGGIYDFYIYEGLVCEKTSKCTFKHDLSKRCDLMVITARRDSTIWGTKEYGYREIPFVLSVLSHDNDKDEYKKCPESFYGADVVIPIYKYLKDREEAQQRKKNAARWDVSPFASSSSNKPTQNGH